ncbi:MAG: hypothetical protein ACKOS8_13850 [Gemmataceae bacterium]
MSTPLAKPPVLVLPTTVVDQWIIGSGFVPSSRLPPLEELLRVEGFHFHPRHLAEEDPSWQQVIPYMVVRSPSGWFRYRRGKAGSENRLHALWSIGVGGHIEPVDGSLVDPHSAYRAGMEREIREELGVNSFGESFLGLLRDPTNAVGRVHLGFIHLVEVKTGVRAAEDALLDGGHGDSEGIRRLTPQMETWSRILIESPECDLGLGPAG